MYDLLLKNGYVITEKNVTKYDIAVKDGKTAEIAKDIKPVTAVKVLDITGKYIMAGVVDCHVHFNEPGYTWREDFSHGTRAAAAGGVTTVIDMPMLNDPAVDNKENLQTKHELLTGKALVDYGFWGALVNYNMAQLPSLNEAGVLAYKCFMCDPGKGYTNLNLAEIEKVLTILKEFDGLAGFHCEDYEMIEELTKKQRGTGDARAYLASRPMEAEYKAVQDIIELLRKTKGKAHICHVSHPTVAQLIKEAKDEGLDISCETCMQYLLYSEADLPDIGPLLKCSPPVRSEQARLKLLDYVIDGTIDIICSDHSPAAQEEKTIDAEHDFFAAWGGVSGVQTSLQTLWDLLITKGKQSPSLLYKLVSLHPAQRFGVGGHKGMIAEGFAADFTVIDADAGWRVTDEQLYYKNKFSAFSGLTGTGKPIMTILRGMIVYDDGVFCKEAVGQMIKKS